MEDTKMRVYIRQYAEQMKANNRFRPCYKEYKTKESVDDLFDDIVSHLQRLHDRSFVARYEDFINSLREDMHAHRVQREKGMLIMDSRLTPKNHAFTGSLHQQLHYANHISGKMKKTRSRLNNNRYNEKTFRTTLDKTQRRPTRTTSKKPVRGITENAKN